MTAPQQQLEALRQAIRRHDELYYGHSRPEISDTEYDKLLKTLQCLEEQFPELVTPDSPTQRVGERRFHNSKKFNTSFRS